MIRYIDCLNCNYNDFVTFFKKGKIGYLPVYSLCKNNEDKELRKIIIINHQTYIKNCPLEE